jgi:Spy/CpxP family protein refolding chaperone
MKRLIAYAVLAAALSQPAFAGDKGHERHMDELTQELQLNPEQAQQVQAIMKEQHEKKRALWDQAKGDREQARSQADALHEETKARLSKILNADQMAKLDQMHEERKGKMGEHRKEREKFIDEMNLSADQKSQVQQILSEQHEKKRALFDAEGDRAAKRAQMEALHQETKTRLATVLNEEQMAKFDSAHAKRMEKRKEFHERRKEKDEADTKQE